MMLVITLNSLIPPSLELLLTKGLRLPDASVPAAVIEDEDNNFGDDVDDDDDELDEFEDEDDDFSVPRGKWGGSKKDPFKDQEKMKDRYGHDSLKDVDRSYGRREFKGKSPLATSKASTLVAREGILDQLKEKFPKKKTPLLSEENIIKE